MNDPTRDVQCVITLVQADGKLAMTATISEGGEDTLAARLVRFMMDAANEKLGEMTGEVKPLGHGRLQ